MVDGHSGTDLNDLIASANSELIASLAQRLRSELELPFDRDAAREKAMLAFNRMDTKGTGALDEEDFALMISSIGGAGENVEDVFCVVDSNQDGGIDFGELFRFLYPESSSHREASKASNNHIAVTVSLVSGEVLGTVQCLQDANLFEACQQFDIGGNIDMVLHGDKELPLKATWKESGVTGDAVITLIVSPTKSLEQVKEEVLPLVEQAMEAETEASFARNGQDEGDTHNFIGWQDQSESDCVPKLSPRGTVELYAQVNKQSRVRGERAVFKVTYNASTEGGFSCFFFKHL